MKTLEDLHTLVRLLHEFKFPVSPILEYEIKNKEEELKNSGVYENETGFNLLNENQTEYSSVKLDFDSTNIERNREVVNVSIPKTSSFRSRETYDTSNKKKPSILRVYREDNSIIDLGIAAYTFCETIKEIGIEKVYGLKIPLDGMYLVNKGANPQYPSAQHDVGNGFFVNVHSNTATKKRQLERIFNTLGINWKVKIIESE